MKNIFKVIFISFIVLLTGCEAEKEFAKQDKIIVRPFSMKSMTAKTNSKLSQAVSNIRKIKTNTTTDSNSSKLVFDEKAGLYFDDEKGLYIEKDNLKSYTFPIIRTSADEKIKNICFNEKPNGNYDVFLVKYDLTKEEVLNLTEEQKALREKQFVALMKDGVNVESFRFQCINITLTTTTEYAAPLDNGELTGNFGYTTVSHTTTVLIGSSCYFDNGSSGGGFNQGVGSNGSYNGNGATGSGSSSNTQPGSDIITGLNTQDFGNSLTDGELFYYNYTSFMSGLNEEQKDVFTSHPELMSYLLSNSWSDNSKSSVNDTINTIIDYQTAYGITPETTATINDFVSSTFNEDSNASSNGDEETPPDCGSFNFTTHSPNSNWQESAVKNINFRVVLLTPQGVYVTHVIEYPQPILFGAPTDLLIGNTNITPGMAASLAAQALWQSMNEAEHKFNNKPVSEMIVQLYFESRLKHNYPLFIPGGRVNIHPREYNVTPTEYHTNWLTTGDCD